MTVSVQISSVTYLGNGAVVAWPYDFPVDQGSWLKVKTKDPTGVLSLISTNEYTVIGLGSPTGGIVTYPKSGTPLQPGWRIRIQRVVPLVQPTEIVNQGSYYPEVMEASADYKIFIDQQLNQRILDLEANDRWG